MGHHALLSIAEVLSVSKNTARILAANADVVVIEDAGNITSLADTLGGVQKIADSLETCTNEEVLEVAAKLLLKEARRLKHKLPFSVSCYGSAEGTQKVLLKGLKKALQDAGVSSRFVHKDMQKNAPNVLIRNQVLSQGADIMVIGDGDRSYVGVTTWVQDVDTYTLRDMHKPRRDMATGMLPPKLAQTLLNLTFPHVGVAHPCVWDPFCGLGVIPMEALLMGLPVVCSDINPKMEENTRMNIEWLTKDGENVPAWGVSTIDARHWATVPTAKGHHPDCIVTEGTLGLNFREPPTEAEAEKEQGELQGLYEDFFHGLTRAEAATIKAVTLTIPFHITAKGEFLRMFPTLVQTIYASGFAPVNLVGKQTDMLKRLGFLQSLTEEGTILYTRSQQFVGREIVVLQRQ